MIKAVSGVTRVGDTRGGNWGCHPSIFSGKTWRPCFAHRCHYHYRFLFLSLGCHPSRVSPHTFFLPVRPRFSTILCKFAHKQIFFLPGRSSPLAPPLVTPLRWIYNVTNLTIQTSRPGYAHPHSCAAECATADHTNHAHFIICLFVSLAMDNDSFITTENFNQEF